MTSRIVSALCLVVFLAIGRAYAVDQATALTGMDDSPYYRYEVLECSPKIDPLSMRLTPL